MLAGDSIPGSRSLPISKAEIISYVTEVVFSKNISPDDLVFALEVALYREVPEGGDAGWIDAAGEDKYSKAALTQQTIVLKSAQLTVRVQ